MFEKDENKLKRGRGWPIFLKKTISLFRYIIEGMNRVQNSTSLVPTIVVPSPKKIIVARVES